MTAPNAPTGEDTGPDRRALMTGMAHFQRPSARASGIQFATTALAYVATLTAMYLLLPVSIWLALSLVVPAAGLVVRLFIIQHDSGHGSYWRSPRANWITGSLCSLATFTPFDAWRRQHAGHHAVWNHLDRRNSGADIYSTCLTVDEYEALSPRRRWAYRAARHPVIAQLLLPPLVFLLLYRTPFDTPVAWRRERASVHLTNLGLAVVLTGLVMLAGWQAVLLIQVPILVITSIAGVWLFSVQHRFEEAQWMRQERWTPVRASLAGSSYLKLPRVLQWFTGNIGFHHVHHLMPRVPNYRLEPCHEVLATRTDEVRTLTLREAFRAPGFALWDEAGERMVPFPR